MVLLLFAMVFFASCKKDQKELPYESTMKGKVGTIIVSIDSLSSSTPGSCAGLFFREIGNNPTYLGFRIQAAKGVPDSLKSWYNYHEKEFEVEIEFMGIGYRCTYVYALGGPDFYEVPVELVEVLTIKEAQK